MLIIGIDSTGKVTKKEFVRRACKQLNIEGYPIFSEPIYKPGATMETIIESMLAFFRCNDGVRRAQLITMLNGAKDWNQWLQRREATWQLIHQFASYMSSHQISFGCIIGGDATMFEGVARDFANFQHDIIELWREVGCCAFTGMEDGIGYGAFRCKLDQGWHIKTQYKEEAVEWIIKVAKT